MKVLFFSQDEVNVEPLVLALRMRWPDLKPFIVTYGTAGFRAIKQEEPDLVCLCEDLPKLDRGSAIKGVRRFSDIPLVVASQDQGEMDVVKALELGADDYIRLPCNAMGLMARVAALMRRTGLSKQRTGERPVECGDLLINPATHEVFLDSTRLMLTPTEFKLLYLLAKNRHVTLSQQFIQRTMWAGNEEAAQALKKYIQRLRRKLGDNARNPRWIKTVHGVGYRFSSPNSNAA